MTKIPRRYKITRAKAKNYVVIHDMKTSKSWWMHVTDFNITHKHLPAYCATEGRAAWDIK
jgi:hypothetical protein